MSTKIVSQTPSPILPTFGGLKRQSRRRRRFGDNSSKHFIKKKGFRTQKFRSQKFRPTQYNKPQHHLFIIYADWCGACKEAKPEFEKMRAKHPHLVHMFEIGTEGVEKRFNPTAFPTIFRSMNISGDGTRTKYSGQRNVFEMEKFLFKK